MAIRMSGLSQNISEAILGRAYPELLYDADPDIEKYFELRTNGRSREALYLYNTRLSTKYPDAENRVLLLRLYRRKDPRFAALQRQCALLLAQAIADRIRRNVRYLTWPLDGVDEGDAFRLISAVEEVVRLLPPDKYEAANALDNYRAYAKLLDYRAEAMARAADIVKEYLFESTQEEEGLREVDFIERSRVMEEARKEKKKSQYFDLSRIEFSERDLSRILLPSHLTRKEDKVLAYCYRYWTLVQDAAFERTILLYSRKHGTRHYDIYRSIKIGRRRKFTDDEILNTVSTIMSSAYSYSVQGDIYMQTAWKRLKASLEQGGLRPQAASAQEAPKAKAKPEKPRSASAREKPKGRAGPSAEPAAAKPPKAAPKKRCRPPRPEASPPLPVPTATTSPRYTITQEKDQPAKEAIRAESVSDIIKRVSGRTWDVYRDAFLEKVGFSIRNHLTENRTHKRIVFDTSLNLGEEIVKAFIVENYDNPYMDWPGSEQRQRVEDLGYAVPELGPIIEDCYHRL